jgi:hypothetical protein
MAGPYPLEIRRKDARGPNPFDEFDAELTSDKDSNPFDEFDQPNDAPYLLQRPDSMRKPPADLGPDPLAGAKRVRPGEMGRAG